MSGLLRRYSGIGIVLLLSLAVFLFFRETVTAILRLVLIAVVLSFLLKPLCSLLERNLPRGAAAVLSVSLSAAALLAFLFLAIPPLFRQITAIGGALSDFARQARPVLTRISRRLETLGLDLNSMEHIPDAGGLFSGTIRFAGNMASAVSDIILSATLSCFFLADRQRLQLKLELLIPAPWRRKTVCMGNAVRREMYLYLRGQALISLAVGVLSAAGLALVRVPSAPALGILAGVLNLIPYFGPFLAAIPAVLVSLQQGLAKAAWAAAILISVQQIDNIILSPRIMGSLTGFSPAAVLLILSAGCGIGGIAGMLLALPSAMLLRTLYRVFVQNSENV